MTSKSKKHSSAAKEIDSAHSSLLPAILPDTQLLQRVLQQPDWSYFDNVSRVAPSASTVQSLPSAPAAIQSQVKCSESQLCKPCVQMRRLTQDHDLKQVARMRKWDTTIIRNVRRLLVDINCVVNSISSIHANACERCSCLITTWQPRRVQTMAELEKMTPAQQATVAEWLRLFRALARPNSLQSTPQ